jgi:hypothetical protein
MRSLVVSISKYFAASRATNITFDVDVDHVPPILNPQVVRGRHRHDAGIVDENIELVRSEGRQDLVANRLAGNFPGSPIELEFVFMLTAKRSRRSLSAHERETTSESLFILVRRFFAILAEPFDPSDDATHHAAYYATDRVPTAHLKTTEGTTGYTQQDITDRMS